MPQGFDDTNVWARVRLERPAAEFAMQCIRHGNVFHNSEKPETKAELKVIRPAEIAFFE